jgi:hypothetical protein
VVVSGVGDDVMREDEREQPKQVRCRGGGLGFGPDWLLGSDEFGGSVTRVKLFNLINLFIRDKYFVTQ